VWIHCLWFDPARGDYVVPTLFTGFGYLDCFLTATPPIAPQDRTLLITERTVVHNIYSEKMDDASLFPSQQATITSCNRSKNDVLSQLRRLLIGNRDMPRTASTGLASTAASHHGDMGMELSMQCNTQANKVYINNLELLACVNHALPKSIFSYPLVAFHFLNLSLPPP
jgi:hypothetical protein